MKLVIATPLYPPDIGGPATYAETLERELGKRDVVVSVVSFHTVRHLPKGFAHLVYTAKLFRACSGADILLALDPVSVGLPAALVALLRKKKFVVKVVGDYAWEQGSQRFGITDTLDVFVQKPSTALPFPVRCLRMIQTIVASHADRLIVPSQYLKGILAQWGVHVERISVVYNAFPGIGDLPDKEECRHRLRLSGTIILSAGRLVPWKGFDVLMAVFANVLPKFPDAELYIAGSGPWRLPLMNQITELGLEGKVVMLGNVEHHTLLEYVRAADCFVLNTGYEGLSHQLLEVLAVGTPIVTTRVGGNPELIEDSVTGRLVDYNDENALDHALDEVLVQPDRANHFAVEGKKFVAQFTVLRMVEDTLMIFKSIIGKT
jgi:glycosyltransferase involved in cell wall biosynthesis